jgi:hypothetical protein
MKTRRTNEAPGGREQRAFTLVVAGAGKQRRKGTCMRTWKTDRADRRLRDAKDLHLGGHFCAPGVYDAAHPQVSNSAGVGHVIAHLEELSGSDCSS